MGTNKSRTLCLGTILGENFGFRLVKEKDELLWIDAIFVKYRRNQFLNNFFIVLKREYYGTYCSHCLKLSW